ncbi:MAG: hypothetical protein ACM3KR_02135 [Deltaproteobacteria bacterium]
MLLAFKNDWGNINAVLIGFPDDIHDDISESEEPNETENEIFTGDFNDLAPEVQLELQGQSVGFDNVPQVTNQQIKQASEEVYRRYQAEKQAELRNKKPKFAEKVEHGGGRGLW